MRPTRSNAEELLLEVCSATSGVARSRSWCAPHPCGNLIEVQQQREHFLKDYGVAYSLHNNIYLPSAEMRFHHPYNLTLEENSPCPQANKPTPLLHSNDIQQGHPAGFRSEGRPFGVG